MHLENKYSNSKLLNMGKNVQLQNGFVHNTGKRNGTLWKHNIIHKHKYTEPPFVSSQ